MNINNAGVPKSLPFCFLFLCVFKLFGQQVNTSADTLAMRLNRYTEQSSLNSVYLRTSKGVFEVHEDVWFKAYVLDAKSLRLSDLDKTLYVQLSRAGSEQVVWREKYPVLTGIVEGHLYLDSLVAEGDYILEAYSAHSFQPKSSFFYASQPIRIIKNLNSLMEKKESAAVSADVANKIQLNILPEGGQLVAGVTNRIAFKAVNHKGEPIHVTGTLVGDSNPIKKFESTHAGMGAFLLKPDPGKKYELRLSGAHAGKTYQLPEIQNNGISMRLIRNDDTLSFKIAQHQQKNRKIHLRVQIRGMTQMIATAILSDSLVISLPTKDIPNGIVEVTIFDESLHPLTERLVYIHQDQQLYITTHLSKYTFGKRERVSIKIKTQDQYGKPVQAHLGINIYDRIYEGAETPRDILTHYSLSTQLRGRIYNPTYYFNSAHKDRKEALDLLLLCQGWRSYQWNEENLKLSAPLEPIIADHSKGQISPVKKNKKSKKPQALLAFNSEENGSSVVPVDSLGNFILTPDELSAGRRIYLKNFAAENEEHVVTIEDPFPAIQKFKQGMEDGSPIAALLPEKREVQTSLIKRGGITLNTILISAKKGSFFRDKYLRKLDSAAKFDANNDYIGNHGPNAEGAWLNCPACSGGPKPIEGMKYTVYIGKNPPGSHPFYFGRDDFKSIIYHYPKFTEEELLKKYKLTKTSGYYAQKSFYSPDYDKEPNSLPDYRNTLLWEPSINTDKSGEVTITFFCSDIVSGFSGIIEGVSASGLLGKKQFNFDVK